jgi:hypothetical protein
MLGKAITWGFLDILLLQFAICYLHHFHLPVIWHYSIYARKHYSNNYSFS